MRVYKKASELLTDDPIEQEIMTLKFSLMNQVLDLIKEKNLTQVKAAQALKVSQPRISRLSCGRASEFSITWLMKAKLSLQKVGL